MYMKRSVNFTFIEYQAYVNRFISNVDLLFSFLSKIWYNIECDNVFQTAL